MTRFVGICVEALIGWDGGDVLGYLLEEGDEGWFAVSSHLSSGPMWSHHDIEEWHYGRVKKDGDTFEWVGLLTSKESVSRFPPAKRRVPDGEQP